MPTIQSSRRHFLAGLSLAGTAGVLGPRRSFADDGPPETTAIRLAYYPNNCLAPLLVAEDLLQAEGFTDIQYVQVPESFTIPAGSVTVTDFEPGAALLRPAGMAGPMTVFTLVFFTVKSLRPR